jgi:hypothetical protein
LFTLNKLAKNQHSESWKNQKKTKSNAFFLYVNFNLVHCRFGEDSDESLRCAVAIASRSKPSVGLWPAKISIEHAFSNHFRKHIGMHLLVCVHRRVTFEIICFNYLDQTWTLYMYKVEEEGTTPCLALMRAERKRWIRAIHSKAEGEQMNSQTSV